MYSLQTLAKATFFSFCGPLNLFTKADKNWKIVILETLHLTKAVLFFKLTLILSQNSNYSKQKLFMESGLVWGSNLKFEGAKCKEFILN